MGSSSNQQSSGATDSAISLSGSSGAAAKDMGIALGSGAQLTTGTRVASSNLTNSTVTFNTGETGLGQTFADTVKQITEQNTAALAAIVQNESRANLPNAATDLPKPGDTVPSDTTTTQPDWLLWAGLAAGAALLAWLFFRK